ncbi:hypothetical protein SAMN06297251_10292 [Fulvimarina manganoxydans]|uniref:Uncharacterized protein n=1 Tax=Fulvimarina manganoxydans TaxID=937218 RepID=A0A1W1YYE6_9HYPH|nr:hypothetical protein SAMN06297251_10292 [Fulvimarina manganoxydans]
MRKTIEVTIPEGWEDIKAAPKDGTRISVAHIADPSSFRRGSSFHETTARFVGDAWSPSAYFVCADGMVRSQPTHWFPARQPNEAAS